MCFWYFLYDKTIKLPNNTYIWSIQKYIWVVLIKSFQMMSHDTLSQLYQKLVTYSFFPKAHMINNILKIQNSAGKVIYYCL